MAIHLNRSASSFVTSLSRDFDGHGTLRMGGPSRVDVSRRKVYGPNIVTTISSMFSDRALPFVGTVHTVADNAKSHETRTLSKAPPKKQMRAKLSVAEPITKLQAKKGKIDRHLQGSGLLHSSRYDRSRNFPILILSRGGGKYWTRADPYTIPPRRL